MWCLLGIYPFLGVFFFVLLVVCCLIAITLHTGNTMRNGQVMGLQGETTHSGGHFVDHQGNRMLGKYIVKLIKDVDCRKVCVKCLRNSM